MAEHREKHQPSPEEEPIREEAFNPLERTPLDRGLYSTHLTWLEQYLIGGTEMDKEGRILTFEEVLARGPQFFLTPRGLTLMDNPTQDDVKKIALERYHKTVPWIELFDKRMRGYMLELLLPIVFPNGEVQPFLSFRVINQESNAPISEQQIYDLIVVQNRELVEEFQDKFYLDVKVPGQEIFSRPVSDDYRNTGYFVVRLKDTYETDESVYDDFPTH